MKMRRFLPVFGNNFLRKRLYAGALLLFWGFWLLTDKPLPIAQLIAEYWPSALTMVFGSIVAGGTPLGGGAVAFPVMTKVLGVAAIDAKLFSLCIQSVGMTFATLFFISRGVPVLWRQLMWAWLGMVVAMPIALFSLTIASSVLKFVFTEFVLITALLLYLARLQPAHRDPPQLRPWVKNVMLIITGAAGAVLSANIGSGADILLFFLLVFVFRCPVKASIPSTVVLMASNSVYAMMWFWLGNQQPLPTFVINSWWLACLVVSIGAPFGGWLLAKLSATRVEQFIFTIIGLEVASSLLGSALSNQLKLWVVITIVLMVCYRQLLNRPKAKTSDKDGD